LAFATFDGSGKQMRFLKPLFKTWIAILAAILVSDLAFGGPAVEVGPAEWTGADRVVVMGDVHGDFEALRTILIAKKLIDEAGRWMGGKAHLVLMGDLIAGASGTKDIFDLVMSLERKAKTRGGRVHTLLGNADLITASGDFSRMSSGEIAGFMPPELSMSRRQRRGVLSDLFLGETPYAEWMRSRPLVVKINDELFVHAGVDENMMGWTLDELNSTARDWIAYFQSRGPMPDLSTEWVVGLKNGRFAHDVGPAFTRAFKVTDEMLKAHFVKRPSGSPKRRVVRAVLEQFGVERMIVGHAPTPRGAILKSHPYYGEMVVLIDTRISDSKHGQLSSLEVTPQGDIEAAYFLRGCLEILDQ